ncbi:MAG: hypothetical protein AAF570_17570, partial [Bacteroidota bacterium]
MNRSTFITQWEPRTIADLDRHVQAKRQVHQAAQLVGAVGRNLLPHQPWDIFGKMEWVPSTGMFAG